MTTYKIIEGKEVDKALNRWLETQYPSEWKENAQIRGQWFWNQFTGRPELHLRFFATEEEYQQTLKEDKKTTWQLFKEWLLR